MVYYFCHCMSIHVYILGEIFVLDSRLAFFFFFFFFFFFGKKLSFWLSACSVLIVVPLL